MSLSTQLAGLKTGWNTIRAAAFALAEQVLYNREHGVTNDVALTAKYGAVQTAVEDQAISLQALTFPTVEIEGASYSITEAEVNYKGTVYSAEDISADEELATEMLGIGVDFLVPVVTCDFSGTPTSGAAPLEVEFTDASEGAPTTWLWNFGDGGTSTLQNPTHTYTVPGDYTVTLTVSNKYSNESEIKTDYISIT